MSDQDIVIPQIPLNPPFSKGEVFLLPLAKGGGEGFYESFFKALKRYVLFRNRSLLFLFAKHLFKQVGGSSCGICANLLLFLAEHMEQSIERLGDDILINVKGLLFHKGDSFISSHQIFILTGDAHLVHRPADDRLEYDR